MTRAALLLALAAPLAGCASAPSAFPSRLADRASGWVGTWLPEVSDAFVDADRGLFESTRAIVPTHPVTGRPVLNLVPVGEEVRRARAAWRELAAEARQRGIAIDRRGVRLARVRRVFERLVAVSHRPRLPWEVHLLEIPEEAAFTWGGGLVVLLDGTFGDLVDSEDEEALAAVLAHEIAHVAMLHPPTRATWMEMAGIVLPSTHDPYYRAAYTTHEEADADRLSTLYLALAGYDPAAAARLWERADDGRGSASRRFLHEHPPDGERARTLREAAALVEPFRVPGRRNPDWRDALADNPLFPRAEDDYFAGAGLVRVGRAARDTFERHSRARREQAQRREALASFERLAVVATRERADDLRVEVYNGSARAVSSLGFAIHYLHGEDFLLLDQCDAPVAIPPDAVGEVACYRQRVPGADRVVAEIVDVAW